MRHTATFASYGGHEYTLTITTAVEGADDTLTLGGTPFTVTTNHDEGKIYIPAKYSGATVNLITGDYLMDLYSPTAQGTKVELSDSNGIVWIGYATPCLYDMGFVEERETISVECVDALSTLKHYRYETDEKRVRPIAEILTGVLKRCNAYRVCYVSANTLTPDGTALIDEGYLSEANFYGDEDDDTWTCQEVLEELCRYLGVTALAYGDAVWLVDYDDLRGGAPSWVVLPLDGKAHPQPPAIPMKTIDGDDYAGNNSRLSLAAVYNKVSVKDEFNTYDDLLPDLFDDAQLYPDSGSFLPVSDADQTVRRAEIEYTHNGYPGTLDIMITRAYPNDKREDLTTYFIASMPMRSDNIATQLNIMGATTSLRKVFVKEIKEIEEFHSPWVMTDEDFVKWASSEVSTLSFETMLQIDMRSAGTSSIFPAMSSMNGTYDLRYADQPPLVVITVPDKSTIFGGADTYLLLTGSVKLSDKSACSFDKGSYTYDKGDSNHVNPDCEYIWARLRWGGLYYRGAEWSADPWSEAPQDFKLYFDNTDAKDLSDLKYKTLNIRNNVKWWEGISSEGFAIPLPKGRLMTGDITLTLYCPAQYYDTSGEKPTRWPSTYGAQSGDGFCSYAWISGIKIKPVIAVLGSDDTASDTVYTNVIDSGYTEEPDDITFRICTFDGKKPNYSSMMVLTNDGYRYVDDTYNSACAAGEADWEGSTGNGLRQEEHMIYRLVNQYSTPSVVLTLPLHIGLHPVQIFGDKTMGKRIYIMDSYETDYKADTQKVRLVEKK